MPWTGRHKWIIYPFAELSKDESLLIDVGQPTPIWSLRC